ncbi:hypothetical protein [Anaerosalibacter massiliensis]|uniref:Uncharacterized protein n=1 Tax=Anaerosalibacter massiliensis TaxID=1347392 RepID=A0A9X2MDM7_9FIRM|nr:hypothetical protein [Anaerosalibacter massiliensis]MCR2043087.1 hypothetical protein [Anaerosalibacter massiliensis]
MDNNDELRKALEKLGNINPTEEEMENMKRIAEDYSGRSEEDIFFEIIKLNEKMEENMNPEEYEELLRKLEDVRPLLDEEQLEKLDKILEVLKDK